MSLRIANIQDFDLVFSMAKKFAEASGYSKHMEEDKIKAIITDLLNGPQERKIIILHGEEGLLAGLVAPFTFGTALMATEVAWWVEPDARGKNVGAELMDAFEFWAKKVGCSLVIVSSIDDKVGKYYEKRGYKLHERAYLKEV